MFAEQVWPKIIAHVDMDSFFASIEQRDFPNLCGRPVVVTNGQTGTCIITRSYEARRYGIKTGMRLQEARRLCPDIIRRPSRPEVYSAVSVEILHALETLTPDIEIFSVDEAFLEFTYCRELYRSPNIIGLRIKHLVWRVSALPCSVGISGDKTTAKFASKRDKPNGLVIIPPWRAEAALACLPVTELCGVARGIGQFLAQYGVYLCRDMKKIPVSVLGKRFGHYGRRIWLMAQGKDSEPLHKDVADPQSMGHGKVIPPNTKDRTILLFFLNHMAEKVAYRLRRHNMQAQRFYVGLKTEAAWIDAKCCTLMPTHDGHLIYAIGRELIENKWRGEGVYQCQITALDPKPAFMQQDLFCSAKTTEKTKVNQVMDDINARYGYGALTNGIRMHTLNMPDVIAPAWRPTGHRATIVVTKDNKVDDKK